MRWNCPHCTAQLSVQDDKVGEEWSFARCYRCSGFSLVKSAGVTLLKVDQPPVGENHINPEPVTNGTTAGHRPPILIPPRLPVHPAHTTPKRPTLPEPLPTISIHTRQWRRHALPVSITLAALLTTLSGAYLYMQGQKVWSESKRMASTTPKGLTPDVRMTAMNEVVAAPSVNAAVAAPIVSDEVTRNLMAPEREPETVRPQKVKPQAEYPGLTVRARSPYANLRSGPGTEYPVVTVARPEMNLIVKDWQDDWFMVIPHSPSGELEVSDNLAGRTAWIRNDLVQVTRQPNR